LAALGLHTLMDHVERLMFRFFRIEAIGHQSRAITATLIGCLVVPLSLCPSLARSAEILFSDADAARAVSYSYLVVPDVVPEADEEDNLQTHLAAFSRRIAGYRVEREAVDRNPVFVGSGADEFRTLIERTIAAIGARAQISVHVRDLESGASVFDHLGHTLLNPASNQKLLTSAAALDLLGPEYGFGTEVLLVGKRLYLVGHGDPSLDMDAMRGLADEVIDNVRVGDLEEIVVDDSAFSPRRWAPGFHATGPGVSYEAPSGALSLEFNTVEIEVRGLRRGEKPSVKVFPAGSHILLANRADGGSGPLYVDTRSSLSDSRSERTVVVVRGHIEPGRRVRVRRRVVDPGLHAGTVFSELIALRSGTAELPVSRGGVTEAAGRPEMVALHESAPLLEIVEGELAYSNNFVAEQLLRTLGWRMTGEPGDWANGGRVLDGYWRALGNRSDSIVFENGSGMSSVGRLTTSGIVDLMAAAHRTQTQGYGLLDALPISGEVGTVRARLRQTHRRVRAKTGTLDGVSGFSGVITDEIGTVKIAFSILINVHDNARLSARYRRRAEDKIVMALLAEVDRRGAKPDPRAG